MYRKETEVGLSRMVAGYAWPWISKKDQNEKKTSKFKESSASGIIVQKDGFIQEKQSMRWDVFIPFKVMI